jgi:hypothetical protein
MSVPLCKDCKHYQRPLVLPGTGRVMGAACLSPRRVRFNPVIGEYPGVIGAHDARRAGDDCGPDGAWFEPEPPTFWQRVRSWFAPKAAP